MTRYIRIEPCRRGQYRYVMALVDEQGEVRKQHRFATDTQTIRNVDFLLRMGYKMTDTSEVAYLQLMQGQ